MRRPCHKWLSVQTEASDRHRPKEPSRKAGTFWLCKTTKNLTHDDSNMATWFFFSWRLQDEWHEPCPSNDGRKLHAICHVRHIPRQTETVSISTVSTGRTNGWRMSFWVSGRWRHKDDHFNGKGSGAKQPDRWKCRRISHFSSHFYDGLSLSFQLLFYDTMMYARPWKKSKLDDQRLGNFHFFVNEKNPPDGSWPPGAFHFSVVWTRP